MNHDHLSPMLPEPSEVQIYEIYFLQSLTQEELLETTSQDALGSFCNYSEVRAYFPCSAMQNPMEYQEFVRYYSNQTQTVSGVISSESVHWVSNRLCFDSEGTARPAGMDAAPIGGETKEFDSKLRLTVIEQAWT